MSTAKANYVLRNLEREARILSSVSHPCIVYIYESIQYRYLYCIVTELVRGNDLSDFLRLQPGGRLNERTSRRFVRQLSSALEHMHARGIVHRDLKLQNIVLDNERALVKIVDFGFSNYWSMEEPLSTHCGSPEYAAPELFIVGKKYGPEVDLWSLGVIIFAMSSGCLPFRLDEKEQSLSYDQQRRLLVSRIQKGILQKHKNLISHYSKDFSQLVCGLLNSNPVRRFRVEDVLSHHWTIKCRSLLLDIPKTVKPNGVLHTKIMAKLSNMTDLMPIDVEKKLMREPLGPLGGMYRILYHEELKIQWRLLEPFSPLHSLSGSVSSGSLVIKTQKSRVSKVKSFEFTGNSAIDPKDNRKSDEITTENHNSLAESPSDIKNALDQEPWSDYLSSITNNGQISLIIGSQKSRTGIYNYRKFLDHEESGKPDGCIKISQVTDTSTTRNETNYTTTESGKKYHKESTLGRTVDFTSQTDISKEERTLN